MPGESDAWLDAPPPNLQHHKHVLGHLLREAARDPRLRLVVVGCSIGRGAADELSDIDAYVGVDEGSWPGMAPEIDGLVRRLGDIVDLRQQILQPPDPTKRPYQHTFALYGSGVQLDLVVSPAPARRQPSPDWVVLYDPDARIQGDTLQTMIDVDQVRAWMFDAFVHLGGCAKYIARDSVWEALESLHRARTELWRLWAAAQRVPDPQYGLTAVLDSPPTPLPDDIDATVASLDRERLLRAAITCCELLLRVWPSAISAVSDGALPPPPLASEVRRQLLTLEDHPSVATAGDLGAGDSRGVRG